MHGLGQVARVEAIHEAKAIDTTGAGDLYAAGFLYGMINGFSLEDCCKAGCCTGGGVVQGLGGEIDASVWDWVYENLEQLRLPVKDDIKQSVKSRHIDSQDQTTEITE
jgi:sugar/nucleoside kinase (ribokinase family)